MLSIKKWLLATVIISSGLIGAQADTDNVTNDESKFAELSRYIAAVDVDGLADSVIDSVAQEGVGVSKSYLEKYFPTVELSFTTAGIYSSTHTKPTFSILVVKPLSDEEDIFNTTHGEAPAGWRSRIQVGSIRVGRCVLRTDSRS